MSSISNLSPFFTMKEGFVFQKIIIITLAKAKDLCHILALVFGKSFLLNQRWMLLTETYD